MDYRAIYEKWCNDTYFDEATRAELKALEGQEAEIEDRFYRQLEFGTGGLRGVIGAGTNRMNVYTVRQATQGLANYIVSQNGQKKGRLLKTASLFHLAAWNFVKQVQAILIPFLYLIRSIIKTVFISHRQDRWNWYLTQRRSGCCMEMHILNYS